MCTQHTKCILLYRQTARAGRWTVCVLFLVWAWSAKGLNGFICVKNGSISTNRSRSSGKPLMASTYIGFVGSRSFMSVLHARRFRPLIRMASDPHIPCAQLRLNARDESCDHLIWWRASKTLLVGYIWTVKSCQYAFGPTSGLYLRMRTRTSNEVFGSLRFIRGLILAPLFVLLFILERASVFSLLGHVVCLSHWLCL